MKYLVAWPAYLLGGAMMTTGVGEIAGFGLITFLLGILLRIGPSGCWEPSLS